MDKWDVRFMEMAQLVSGWSSCYRAGRAIGCVIVRNDKVIARAHNRKVRKDCAVFHADRDVFHLLSGNRSFIERPYRFDVVSGLYIFHMISPPKRAGFKPAPLRRFPPRDGWSSADTALCPWGTG